MAMEITHVEPYQAIPGHTDEMATFSYGRTNLPGCPICRWFYVAHMAACSQFHSMFSRDVFIHWGSTHFLCEHKAIYQFSVISSGSQPDVERVTPTGGCCLQHGLAPGARETLKPSQTTRLIIIEWLNDHWTPSC